jgi:endonuclease YncB( thermonuclease family)
MASLLLAEVGEGSVMAMFAFILLISALALFIISTRQWAVWLRGAVWAGGLLLLVVAWLLLGSSERDPELATALGDLAAKWYKPGESMLLRMLESNGATVSRMILSLFDIFLFFAVLVGIVALVAFRPGEELEKAIRPVMTGMIGAILGGVFALAMVGTGFGQREERQAYAGAATIETAHSGEMLLLNGDLLRLRGIDAPEPGQICRLGTRVQDCSEESQRALRRILDGAFVMCALERPKDTNDTTRREKVATCTAVKSGGEGFDVARRMVEEGYAVGVDGAFAAEAAEATARVRGLSAWCTVRPDAWALMPQAKKNAFRDKGEYARGTPMMGTCAPPPATPSGRPKQGSTPVVRAPD